MGLKIFNTLTRQIEPFIPLDPVGRKVGMYSCGPTIYDYAHIGNFRSFVFVDLVRRYLEFKGFEVCHVMNITDVEDKIIRRVRASGQTLKEFTGRYEKAFLEDMATLGCRTPHRLPRATEHLPQIIDLIGRLMERGLAYRASDGSVYFSIEKYRAAGMKYGQLVHLNFEEMRPGERVQHDEYDKESVADFALWKARSPEDGEVYWPSPWGEGRPGWHIECSAMSMEALGPSFDLHMGGEDLVFPHHEDEIAQSEGSGMQAEGCHFVKYWLHGAHLLVEGKKMSKSLGNYFTLRDLLAKGYKGREIRYLLLKAHYRDTLNFTMDGLEEARTALSRMDECVGKLQELTGGKAGSGQGASLVARFEEALDENLNISAAWASVFDWVRETNRGLSDGTLTAEAGARQLGAWNRVADVVGLGQAEVVLETAPPEVLAKLEERQAARRAKDFRRADQVRDEIHALGWMIEDTPKGPKLKRA